MKWFVLFLGVALQAADEDPAAIVDRATRHALSRSMRYEGLIRVTSAAGKSSEKRWLFERVGEPGAGKIVVRFQYPPEVKGVGLLILCRPGAESDQWLYTPAIARTRRISTAARGNRFFSTDLTFADFEEGHSRDFDLRLLGSERLGEEEAWRIEAKPRRRAQYDHKILWISKTRDVILRADIRSKQEVLRRILPRKWSQVQGVWSPVETEVSDLKTGSRTVITMVNLEYGIPLPPSRFTPQALEDPLG